MEEIINRIRIANLFRKSDKISNKNSDENDTSTTDIEAGEEDFFHGFIGKNARMSICSTTINNNNNLLVDDTKRDSISEVPTKVNSFIDPGSGDDENESNWKIPIDTFSSKKQVIKKYKSKRICSYYKAQNELIETFEGIQMGIDDANDNFNKQKYLRRQVSVLLQVSFIANLTLLIVKFVAVEESGSISVISSLVESGMDLTAGIIIWCTTKAMKNQDRYRYPQGKTKLEPIAIVIISALMAMASLLLIKESITKLIMIALYPDYSTPNYDLVTIVITVTTVVVKLVLYFVCRRVMAPLCQALSEDHRNDAMSNTVVVICGYIGSEQMRQNTEIYSLAYVDPIGAILISIYIACIWLKIGYEQITLLTGHTANPVVLKKLAWLALNHSKDIKYIDTLRAFHFGTNFLVELDIVLPEDMKLRRAHDIGEALQQKLEKLPEVERAFVHLDYEYEHSPHIEHKIV